MDLILVTKAAAVAAEAHRSQRRKASDTPYVNHLIRVAHEAAQAGLSSECVAAALLHDTVEDTEVKLEELEKQFPKRVVHLVKLLTKWWPDDAPAETKQSEKPKYYSGILSDQEAIELKLLDRADNLRDMAASVSFTRKWSERYFKKTEVEIAPIVAQSKNPHARKSYLDALETLRNALGR